VTPLYLLDNYRPSAFLNNLLKLWTTLTKDAGSKSAETHGILSEQQYGFRLLRNIHDALASIIMTMEDAKICIKDIYIMYADFKGAFNATGHRIRLGVDDIIRTISTYFVVLFGDPECETYPKSQRDPLVKYRRYHRTLALPPHHV
jgi:hypothetical protein